MGERGFWSPSHLGDVYLWLSKAHKNLTLNHAGGELHGSSPLQLFVVILQTCIWLIIDKIRPDSLELQGTSTPRHPLQVALILYNIHVRRIILLTHTRLPHLIPWTDASTTTWPLMALICTRLSCPVSFIHCIPMYIKLTVGAGWDGGRATSPPVHEADGLVAQLRPSLVYQKKGRDIPSLEMVGTPFRSTSWDECICTCRPKKKAKTFYSLKSPKTFLILPIEVFLC